MQMSYETCGIDLIDVESSEEHAVVYEESTKLWTRLYAELLKSGAKKTAFWAGESEAPSHFWILLICLLSHVS